MEPFIFLHILLLLTYDYFTDRAIIGLCHHIVSTVGACVHKYLDIFQHCWDMTLSTLFLLINGYYWFLRFLVYRFTSYPFCIYGTICLTMSLAALCYINVNRYL